MLEIRCPYCGKRSQNEFSYGGDGNIKRPTLGEEINTKDWHVSILKDDQPTRFYYKVSYVFLE